MKAADTACIALFPFYLSFVPVFAKDAFGPVSGLFAGIFYTRDVTLKVKVIFLGHGPRDTAGIDVGIDLAGVYTADYGGILAVLANVIALVFKDFGIVHVKGTVHGIGKEQHKAAELIVHSLKILADTVSCPSHLGI